MSLLLNPQTKLTIPKPKKKAPSFFARNLSPSLSLSPSSLSRTFTCNVLLRPERLTPEAQRTVQDSESFKISEVLVGLPSDTPVVDVEINPYVNVVPKQSSLGVPKHSLTFAWYRKQFTSCQAEIRCSTHHDKLATIQCTSCVKLDLPFEESYHCSPSCFKNAWEEHKVSHNRASETARTTNGQAGEKLSGSLHGKHWIKSEWLNVGSSKSYKPTLNDCGSILKLEVVGADCSTGTPLSPVKIIETNSVITAPNC